MSYVRTTLPSSTTLRFRADRLTTSRSGGSLVWKIDQNKTSGMIGAQSAPHRIENGVLKVYDRNSPVVRPFNYEDLPFEEEFYRFDTTGQGRLRWDQVRVLLTVALDDPKVEPRPWTGYKRPDNIYPVAWIRTYGKGRVFYNSMGHMPDTFTTPEIVGHFLSGIQFILGDLDADATPNPPSSSHGPAATLFIQNAAPMPISNSATEPVIGQCEGCGT